MSVLFFLGRRECISYITPIFFPNIPILYHNIVVSIFLSDIPILPDSLLILNKRRHLDLDASARRQEIRETELRDMISDGRAMDALL